MKQSSIDFLEENRHHYDTLVKAGFVQHLDYPTRERILAIIHEEFNPGYIGQLWCQSCVADMITYCYKQYLKYLATIDVTEVQAETAAEVEVETESEDTESESKESETENVETTETESLADIEIDSEISPGTDTIRDVPMTFPNHAPAEGLAAEGRAIETSAPKVKRAYKKREPKMK